MMAGTGRKTFTAGAVLAAADVQSYLQDQSVMVFDSSAARSSAIGTAVSEGMVSYLKDTDLVESYNGSVWVSVAPASQSGLNIVAPTSIANSGGSATATGGQVAFSAVTSISLNGVFTASYENYQALLTLTMTSNTNLYVRFRLAGTDNTANIYTIQDIAADSTTVGASRSTTTTGGFGYGDAQTISSTFYRPAVAVETKYNSVIVRGLTSLLWQSFNGFHGAATAYDGITIYPASGTMTGTVRFYGLKNS
jgi:hypothetical protein